MCFLECEIYLTWLQLREQDKMKNTLKMIYRSLSAGAKSAGESGELDSIYDRSPHNPKLNKTTNSNSHQNWSALLKVTIFKALVLLWNKYISLFGWFRFLVLIDAIFFIRTEVQQSK